jgi:hypothetical protein
MGTFDDFHCQYPLPVPEAQHQVFQTKDLECYQETYKLRSDGMLWKTHYDVEDRSDPNATGLMRLAGCATRINPREVFEPYTGEVRFYGFYAMDDLSLGKDGQGWVTFLATLLEGCLQSLIVHEHDRPRPWWRKNANRTLRSRFPHCLWCP